jgi:hypothetical protein
LSQARAINSSASLSFGLVSLFESLRYSSASFRYSATNFMATLWATKGSEPVHVIPRVWYAEMKKRPREIHIFTKQLSAPTRQALVFRQHTKGIRALPRTHYCKVRPSVHEFPRRACRRLGKLQAAFHPRSFTANSLPLVQITLNDAHSHDRKHDYPPSSATGILPSKPELFLLLQVGERTSSTQCTGQHLSVEGEPGADPACRCAMCAHFSRQIGRPQPRPHPWPLRLNNKMITGGFAPSQEESIRSRTRGRPPVQSSRSSCLLVN